MNFPELTLFSGGITEIVYFVVGMHNSQDMNAGMHGRIGKWSVGGHAYGRGAEKGMESGVSKHQVEEDGSIQNHGYNLTNENKRSPPNNSIAGGVRTLGDYNSLRSKPSNDPIFNSNDPIFGTRTRSSSRSSRSGTRSNRSASRSIANHPRNVPDSESPHPDELTPLSALAGHRRLNTYESEKLRRDHEKWKTQSKIWMGFIANEDHTGFIEASPKKAPNEYEESPTNFQRRPNRFLKKAQRNFLSKECPT